MPKIKVAIIGAGNISNTRHIPALKKIKNAEIIGVVGIKIKNIERTLNKYKIANSLLVNDANVYDAMKNSDWFQTVDAVVIGAPPREHYPMAEASLQLSKHVLVEKPMTMDEEEADKLIALAKKKGKQLCVMHNFQYTSGMRKLEGIISRGGLGKLVSFYEFQLTNRRRRLPEWYYELPLGLFYDEASHFMYVLEKFGGPLTIENAFAQYGSEKDDNTPQLLSVSLRTGEYPAHIFLNFDSPISEWYFVASGEKKVAFYDLFKDILIVLPSDNEHYALDVLKNSWRATYQFWAGFIKNGFKMVAGNLLYGHDIVMHKFIDAVANGKDIDAEIDGQAGKRTVGYMQAIINNAKLGGKK